jgi:maleylpyruvate isomerase
MVPVTHDVAPAPDLADLLAAADQALVRTVDGLTDAAYAEPSLLPDWSRAHVVAHLTLNAEGLAAVLHGAHLGRPRTMYASNDARNDDIAELAATEPAELRERFLASIGRFGDALAAMADDDWDGTFERTPDAGTRIRLANVPLMRLREVQIHHADLDAGYTADDWPTGFRTVLLDSLTRFPSPPLEARPTDLDRTWHYGQGGGGPVVTGTSAAIGWWLTGRGTGQGVTSDAGDLPEVESW